MTSGMAGQPGTLSWGLLGKSLCSGVAAVGLGLAAWTQPQEAQVPQATTALACSTPRASLSIKGLPPSMQYMPWPFRGVLPSTARMYCPLYLLMASS